MKKEESKAVDLMLTSYKAGASAKDVFLQVCRVAAVYLGFALAGVAVVFGNYLFAGHVRFLLLALAGVAILVVVGLAVAFFDPTLRAIVFGGRTRRDEEPPKADAAGGGR